MKFYRSILLWLLLDQLNEMYCENEQSEEITNSYKILNLDENASNREIKRAYMDLVKKW